MRTARVLNRTDDIVNRFFYEALKALGDQASRCPTVLVLKTGEVNLRCMKLLDEANTAAFGDPVPTQVPLTIEKGPFIVVSGHDLHDMKLLLEQTKDRGVNIYTGARCCLPTATELQPAPKGQFRHRLAEPADGVPQYPCTDFVHHKLPHARAAKLFRPRVHHIRRLLPGAAAHRRR